MKELSAAIIIPVKYFNSNLKKAIKECLNLNYKNYEVLIFPDEIGDGFKQFEGDKKVKVIPTGNIGPAEKRDKALKVSTADLFAFLDDDAYPQCDWLEKAVKNFKGEEVAAVGGPSVTPPESHFLEHASGQVFSSVLTSAGYIYRYLQVNRSFEVDDYPSCNFIVRRSIFEELEGFDNTFWPGEDTKLCLDITKKLGKKIIYDSSVLVYHHRRRLGPAHFKQVANYALHRGYFAKRYPENSRKAAYFVPSLFVLFLAMGFMFGLVNKNFLMIYLYSLVIYVLTILAVSVYNLIKDEELTMLMKMLLLLPVSFGIFFTHISYGIYFMIGLVSKQLKDER